MWGQGSAAAPTSRCLWARLCYCTIATLKHWPKPRRVDGRVGLVFGRPGEKPPQRPVLPVPPETGALLEPGQEKSPAEL